MNDILTVKQADYLNDYKLIIHNPTPTLVTVVILSKLIGEWGGISDRAAKEMGKAFGESVFLL